jgi:hypothetical protein
MQAALALRSRGGLQRHGDAVGDNLTTGAFFLLLAALCGSGYLEPAAITQEDLLERVVAFDAAAMYVEAASTSLDGSLSLHECSLRRPFGWRKRSALLIRMDGRNLASCVTDPSWAALQNLAAFLLHRPRVVDRLRKAFPSAVREFTQVRLLLKSDHEGRPVDVVATYWHLGNQPMGAQASLLIVVTGNDNSRHYHSECHDAVVTITWRGDHTKPAAWFFNFLHAMGQAFDGIVDVFGLSRGACEIFAACSLDNSADSRARAEELPLGVRHLFDSDCIWERQTKEKGQKGRSAILRGLRVKRTVVFGVLEAHDVLQR